MVQAIVRGVTFIALMLSWTPKKGYLQESDVSHILIADLLHTAATRANLQEAQIKNLLRIDWDVLQVGNQILQNEKLPPLIESLDPWELPLQSQNTFECIFSIICPWPGCEWMIEGRDPRFNWTLHTDSDGELTCHEVPPNAAGKNWRLMIEYGSLHQIDKSRFQNMLLSEYAVAKEHLLGELSSYNSVKKETFKQGRLPRNKKCPICGYICGTNREKFNHHTFCTNKQHNQAQEGKSPDPPAPQMDTTKTYSDSPDPDLVTAKEPMASRGRIFSASYWNCLICAICGFSIPRSWAPSQTTQALLALKGHYRVEHPEITPETTQIQQPRTKKTEIKPLFAPHPPLRHIFQYDVPDWELNLTYGTIGDIDDTGSWSQILAKAKRDITLATTTFSSSRAYDVALRIGSSRKRHYDHFQPHLIRAATNSHIAYLILLKDLDHAPPHPHRHETNHKDHQEISIQHYFEQINKLKSRNLSHISIIKKNSSTSKFQKIKKQRSVIQHILKKYPLPKGNPPIIKKHKNKINTLNSIMNIPLSVGRLRVSELVAVLIRVRPEHEKKMFNVLL